MSDTATQDQTKTPDGTEGQDQQTYTEKDIQGLKAKNQELLRSVKETKERLKAFEGIDPEKVRSAIQAAEAAEEERAKKAGEFDKILAKKDQEYQKQLDEARLRLERITKRAFEREALNAGRAALAEVAVAPESVDLLLPHFLRQVKVVENDHGDFVTVVVDDAGEVRTKGPKLEPMTVADLVAEMAEDKRFALVVKGKAGRGSGATQSSGPGGFAVKTLADFKSDAEKVAFIREKGLEAFKALPPR